MSRWGIPFRSDVEGLRAIAILVVIGYHASIPGFRGGFLGVDVFFVLSGFLITAQLLRELEGAGKIDLLRFYARRARRLVPALTILLAFVGVSAFFVYAPHEQRGVTNQLISAAVYLSNVYFTRRSTAYFVEDLDTLPLLHTWSLGVEEQFYLGWPLILLAISLFRQGSSWKWLLSFAVIAAGSFLLSVPAGSCWTALAFYNVPFRIWEFSAGAIVAVLPKSRCASDYAVAGGAVLLISAIPLASTSWIHPGPVTLMPVVGTAMILAGGNSQNLVTSVLRLSWMQWLGAISYSWYLWHWPLIVLGVALGLVSSPVERLLASIVAIVPASLSYYLVETPVRRGRLIPVRALIMTAGAVGLVAVCGWSWREWAVASTEKGDHVMWGERARGGKHSGGCEASLDVSTLCVSGDQGRIVLIGDSYAEHLIPGLSVLARKESWTLHIIARRGCAPPLEGEEGSECGAWFGDAMDEIYGIEPDLVIMSWVDPGSSPEDERDRIRRLALGLEEISRAADEVVLITGFPTPDIDPVACSARNEWRKNWWSESDCSCELIFKDRDRFANLVVEKTEAGILDISSAIEETVREEGCAATFRDRGHLSAEGSVRSVESIAGALEAALARGKG